MIIEQKVGISLCMGGQATRIAGSHLCKLEKGMAIIVSPALPTVELERSPDFREQTITVDVSEISGETAPFFPKMMPVLSASVPVIRLNEDLQKWVIETAGHIEKRESIGPDGEMFAQMNQRLVTLLRLQIILEVMYEMAAGKRPAREKCHGPNRSSSALCSRWGFIMRSATLSPATPERRIFRYGIFRL